MLLKPFLLVLGFTLSLPLLAQDLATEFTVIKQQLNQLRNTVLEQELKLNAQQRELQLLRGDNEVLMHRIEQLKQQQQATVATLQQQLNQLQNPLAAAPTSPSSAPVSQPISQPTTVATPPQQTPVASPPTTASVTPPAGVPQSERAVYDAAFKLLEARQYQAAIVGFQQVIDGYAKGQYADNAQYWIAESYYALKEYARALGEFNRLLKQHPDSDKRSHAELKMGYVYYELQDFVAARSMLEQVKLNYPNSAIARLAQEKLKKFPSHF